MGLLPLRPQNPKIPRQGFVSTTPPKHGVSRNLPGQKLGREKSSQLAGNAGDHPAKEKEQQPSLPFNESVGRAKHVSPWPMPTPAAPRDHAGLAAKRPAARRRAFTHCRPGAQLLQPFQPGVRIAYVKIHPGEAKMKRFLAAVPLTSLLLIPPLLPQAALSAAAPAAGASAIRPVGAAATLASELRYASAAPPDYIKATGWWRKAAAAGNARAMNGIGHIHEHGCGAPHDHGNAVGWYREAAAAGNTGAMNNIGFLYEEGLGVPKDPAGAARWLRGAA